ncbi:transcription factor GAMYB [Lathyrus oleraceus]|nr:transcription factor GAMYB-like [Pisum sativum]
MPFFYSTEKLSSWFNHLRPGLKKDSFTAEEERLIFEYHFLKGSKWAHMAALLPGRTDNEIKNFWYTRSKKRQRAGLSIYPNEITSKYSFNGSQESADTLANESGQSDETENFNMDITDLDLKDYKFCPDMLPPFFDSQDAWIRHRYLISSSSASVPEVFDQYCQYPMLSTPFDPILDTNLLHGYDNPIPGFHAASNISSSEPIYGSMSFELPSFQSSQTQQCTWSGMYVSPLPSFESVDTPVQAPPIESCLFVPVPVPVPDSPDWSHLIDPIVYYNSDQNLKGTSIDSLQAYTESMAPNEADISKQWNGLDYDQCPALSTRQINISRWFHSEIETALDDIYGGAFNDQLPAYSSFDKEDNLNQKGLALPNVVLDSG